MKRSRIWMVCAIVIFALMTCAAAKPVDKNGITITPLTPPSSKFTEPTTAPEETETPETEDKLSYEPEDGEKKLAEIEAICKKTDQTIREEAQALLDKLEKSSDFYGTNPSLVLDFYSQTQESIQLAYEEIESLSLDYFRIISLQAVKNPPSGEDLLSDYYDTLEPYSEEYLFENLEVHDEIEQWWFDKTWGDDRLLNAHFWIGDPTDEAKDTLETFMEESALWDYLEATQNLLIGVQNLNEQKLPMTEKDRKLWDSLETGEIDFLTMLQEMSLIEKEYHITEKDGVLTYDPEDPKSMIAAVRYVYGKANQTVQEEYEALIRKLGDSYDSYEKNKPEIEAFYALTVDNLRIVYTDLEAVCKDYFQLTALKMAEHHQFFAVADAMLEELDDALSDCEDAYIDGCYDLYQEIQQLSFELIKKGTNKKQGTENTWAMNKGADARRALNTAELENPLEEAYDIAYNTLYEINKLYMYKMDESVSRELKTLWTRFEKGEIEFADVMAHMRDGN